MSATGPRELSFGEYRSWLLDICDCDSIDNYYGVAEVATFEGDRLALIRPYTSDHQGVYLAYGRKQIMDIAHYSYRQLFNELSVILAATPYRESPNIIECILLARKEFQKNLE